MLWSKPKKETYERYKFIKTEKHGGFRDREI